MTISGDYRYRDLPEIRNAQAREGRRARAPQASENERQARAARRASPKKTPVHEADRLRDTVAKLMDSGEIDLRADGQVREDRVEAARRNTVSGTYEQKDVIGQIVDRLLEQWNI